MAREGKLSRKNKIHFIGLKHINKGISKSNFYCITFVIFKSKKLGYFKKINI